jgi:hypothetical protein
MSCYFDVDGTTLWNPSNTVGRLFKAEVEAVASTLHLTSGLGDIIEDVYEIDLPIFEKFLAELVGQYHRVMHPIFRSLTVSIIATASVLVERADGRLPHAEPDQAAAWSQLRHEHGRSMSR